MKDCDHVWEASNPQIIMLDGSFNQEAQETNFVFCIKCDKKQYGK